MSILSEFEMLTRYARAIASICPVETGLHRPNYDAVVTAEGLMALVLDECERREADAVIQPAFEWKYAVPRFIQR